MNSSVNFNAYKPAREGYMKVQSLLPLILLVGPTLVGGVIVAAHAGPVTIALFGGTFIGWLTAVPATLMVVSIITRRQTQPPTPQPEQSAQSIYALVPGNLPSNTTPLIQAARARREPRSLVELVP